MSFLQRSWNLGNFLVVVGVLALGLSLAWPYVAARRVARVESWAADIIASLLDAAGEDATRFTTPAAARELLASLPNRRIAERLRVLDDDEVPHLGSGVYLEGKHFYYLLTVAEPPDPATVDDESPPPPPRFLEIYAWPGSRFGPSRSAFYGDSSGQRAYTHNLHTRYHGLDRIPRAGVARRATGADAPPIEEIESYRGEDEEQWVPLPDEKPQ
jgi:hypothetical protein